MMKKSMSIKQLVGIIIIAMLVFLPNLVNAFLTKSETVAGLYVAQTFLMLGLLYTFRWRKITLFLLPFILFSGIAGAFLSVTKVKLGYHVYASVFETHSDEVLSFFKNPLFFKIALRAVLPVIITLIIFFSRGFPFLSKKTIKLPGLLLLPGLAVSLMIIGYGYKRDFLKMYYPGTIIHSYGIYFNELKKVKDEYKKMTYRFKGIKTDSIQETILLVMGESERKKSLNLYGYTRPTTPYIAALMKENPDHILVFKNAATVAPWTRIAVPLALSFAQAKDYPTLFQTPSITKVFAGLNYKTTMISNQDQTMIDMSHYLIAAFSGEMDTVVSCQKEFEERYDQNVVEALSPFLREKDTSNRFFFLHLMGSHYEYADRVPETKRFFKGGTLIDDYDNTVRYTDYILSELAEMVFRQETPFLLIYLSDHGEYVGDFGDTNYGHGFAQPTAVEVEIPFIVLYNDAFYRLKKEKINNLQKNIDKKISLDNVSHTLMGLYGDLDATLYDATYDLSSPYFEENKRFFIDSDNHILRLEDISLRRK